MVEARQLLEGAVDTHVHSSPDLVECKPSAAVVRGWGQRQGRATTGLLATGLWIEGKPDEVAAVRNVWTW